MKYKLKAKQEFFYDGATRKTGDTFEAVDPDANILCCLGKAEKVQLEAAAVKAEEPTAPAAPVPVETADDPSPRRRRYQRRDMVPEE